MGKISVDSIDDDLFSCSSLVNPEQIFFELLDSLSSNWFEDDDVSWSIVVDPSTSEQKKWMFLVDERHLLFSFTVFWNNLNMIKSVMFFSSSVFVCFCLSPSLAFFLSLSLLPASIREKENAAKLHFSSSKQKKYPKKKMRHKPILKRRNNQCLPSINRVLLLLLVLFISSNSWTIVCKSTSELSGE